MARGRKKKFKLKINIKPDSVRSVIAVLLLLFAALSLISFIFPGYVLNEKIQSFWRGLFGFPSILITILLGMTGLLFIDPLKHKVKEPRVVLGIFLLLLSLSGLFHIFYSIEESYNIAKEGKGGGIVGYKVASILTSTVSKFGGFLVLAALFIISLVVIFDLSLDRVLKFFQGEDGKENLFSKIKETFSKKKGVEDDIEISSGAPLGEELQKQSEGSVGTESEEILEPTFEIIQTKAEPYNPDAEPAAGISGAKIKPSGLPYADRVWQYPPLDLLLDGYDTSVDVGDTEARAKRIVETLKSFGVDAEVVDIKVGPSVTQYSLKTEEGTRIASVAGLHNDLALALASPTGSVRIEAPIPGKSLIGIEVPNTKRATVDFKSLITSDAMKGMESKLGIVLGKDVGGRVHVYDIERMPHMLIAGTTGSGKSVFIHNMLFSMLYRASPQEVRFIMIDPKRVELNHYSDIPHLLTPVITENEKAASVFKWAMAEMDRRYKLLDSARVRNIAGYNDKSGFQAMPYIVIVVDELADIMVVDPAGVEKSIIRIAQLARATGIHLMLAMQRPDTNVITGLIKANIPCRISFKVISQIDSRVILDQPGAEKLLGQGDMLFIPPDVSKPVRLQSGFVSDKEIFNLVNYLKSQGVEPDYKEEILQMVEKPKSSVSTYGGDIDDLFDEAVEVIVTAEKASASLLQRKLSIGYARAARILDELEEKGFVGPPDGSKPRDVLIDRVPSQEDDNKVNFDPPDLRISEKAPSSPTDSGNSGLNRTDGEKNDKNQPDYEEYNPDEQKALKRIDSLS